ncbi:MAG: Rnf-Nqr domain containing protein [candidate division WOR-3 bacterium]
MNSKYKESELVIILGLTPFIALTDSAVHSLSIGILVIITLFFSSLVLRHIDRYIKEPEKSIVFFITTATIVTILGGFLSHKIPELYNELGIFIPLIAVNSYIFYSLKKIDNKSSGIKYGFASIKRYSPAFSVLFIVGLLREIFGKGMVLNKPFLNADPDKTLILFFDAPAASFIITGIVIALYGLMRKKNE